MLDLGWTELLVIGIVALIVVGPKDLPVMFHSLGKFTARMRSMARDFSRAMDDAAKESGARDIARDLRSMSNPTSAGKKAFKSAVGLDDPFGEDDDGKPDGSPDQSKGDEAKSDARPAHGPNTAALAETRAAEAKARREEAAARANDRSAAFKGFEGSGSAGSGSEGSDRECATPAPGGDAPEPSRDSAGETDAPRRAAGDTA